MQCYLFAFELGQRAQGRVLEYQNGRAVGLGWLGAHIHQVFTGGLGEHRWRVARQAKFQAADRERFEQLGAGGKFNPADLGLRKTFFQRALLFENDQVGCGFLVSDAQHFGQLFRSFGRRALRQGRTHNRAAQTPGAGGDRKKLQGSATRGQWLGCVVLRVGHDVNLW